MNKQNTRGFVLSFVAVTFALLAIGGFASYALYERIDDKNRAELLKNTALMARTLPLSEIQMLSGEPMDVDSPEYKRVKVALQEGLAVDGDIRFTYLMGQNEKDELFFFADSEEVGSADESKPGDVYYEATEGMKNIFVSGKGIAEGPDRDRWGVWISAYWPIKNVDGNVVALLGMDIPANDFIFDIVVYSLFPILVALLIILLLYIIHRNEPKTSY